MFVAYDVPVAPVVIQRLIPTGVGTNRIFVVAGSNDLAVFVYDNSSDPPFQTSRTVARRIRHVHPDFVLLRGPRCRTGRKVYMLEYLRVEVLRGDIRGVVDDHVGLVHTELDLLTPIDFFISVARIVRKEVCLCETVRFIVGYSDAVPTTLLRCDKRYERKLITKEITKAVHLSYVADAVNHQEGRDLRLRVLPFLEEALERRLHNFLRHCHVDENPRVMLFSELISEQLEVVPLGRLVAMELHPSGL